MSNKTLIFDKYFILLLPSCQESTQNLKTDCIFYQAKYQVLCFIQYCQKDKWLKNKPAMRLKKDKKETTDSTFNSPASNFWWYSSECNILLEVNSHELTSGLKFM